ncbi:MAG: InlB B-repeat-containing protein, partial [Kiritimatiellae bacterium]|nr:InlB B-repeat-containing protein [Kiritimatiellia bacterium]
MKIVKIWGLVLALAAGGLASVIPADAKAAAPRDDSSCRMSRRSASGRIAVRAGRKRFPANAEVSLSRTRANNVMGRIKNGLKKRRGHHEGRGKCDPSVLAMYDISIRAGGKKWQPDAGEPVRVDIELDEPVAVAAGNVPAVVHLADDGTVEELDASRYGFTYNKDKSAVTAFWFSATGFSVYAITLEDGTYSPNRRLYDFYSLDFNRYLEDGVTSNTTYNTYVPRYFTTVEGNRTFRQIVRSGEYLVRPEALPSPFGRTFIGWYLYSTNNANQTVEGVTYDAEGYATMPFDFTQPVVFDDTPDGGDENHGAREFVLRSVFAREGYVIFHEQPTGGKWPITAVRRAEMRELTPGTMTASVQIDDITVTYDDTEDHDGEEQENTAPKMIFRGWSATPVMPGSLVDTNGNDVVLLSSPYVFTRQKDTPATPRHLFPVFVNINWLTFQAAESGTGATYIPPHFYYADEGTNSFPVPHRTGYTFDGWWTGTNTGVRVTDSSGALTATASQLSDWGGTVVDGKLRLTESVTIYGRWNPAPTKYTVVVWQQKSTDAANLAVADRTYDFVASYTNYAMSATSVSVAQTYKNWSGQAANASHDEDYTGFTYARCDGDQVVDGNGTTVLNVYYDRDVHTLRFFTSQPSISTTIRYTYNGTEKTTTPGAVLSITSRAQNQKTIGDYTVAKRNNSNTYYINIDGTWYTTLAEVYNATAISVEPTYSPAPVHTVTALYGASVKDEFPVVGTDGTVYDGESWEDKSSTVYFSQRLAAIETMPDANIDFVKHTRSGSTTGGYIYYYVEVDESEGYETTFNGKYYKLYKTIHHDFNFLTFDEEFHPISGYVTDRSHADPAFGTYNNDSDKAKLDTTNGNKLYYDREDYTIEFKDSYTQNVLKDADIKYSQAISNSVPANPASSRPGYNFTGWYVDDACSTRVFFDEETYNNSNLTNKMLYAKMPAHNLQIFAGWETEWYLIQIDPNGGQLPAGQSTWFWEAYDGDPIEEYVATSRSYVEALNGTWFYALKNRAYYGYGDEWVSGENGDRGAYYTQDINDPAIVPDGKRYSQAVNAYRYAGWYEVDPDTGAETLYAFGQPVQRNTTLRLHWKHIGTYRLHYDPGMGQMSERDENEDTFKLL